jgi:ubiquitin carboxyl-terminal hydrolase 34
MLLVDQTLTANIEKQGKYLSLALRQKLVHYATNLLPYISRTDDQLRELLSTLLGEASESNLDILVPLWQLKIARTYITKGRMDLRVAGASLLSDELDRICYQHGHMDPGSGNLYPALRRIAQTIIDQKLLDAILGVDSHEQIIAQSRGIAKYLIITKDHGHVLLDLIWNTITNGQNPGTVRATTELLGYLLNSNEEEALIMSVEDVHYVCEKIRTAPPMILGSGFLDTISNLFRPLSFFFAPPSSTRAIEELATNSLSLYLGLIGIARKTFNHQSECLLQLCRYALLNLAPIIPDVSRRAFYNSCLDIIRERSSDADAVFDAMNAIFDAANSRSFPWKDSLQDLHMLVQELNLTEILIGDMQWFVSQRLQVDHSDDPLLLDNFKARVTFLLFLIEKQPDCVTDANFEILWNCLVGDGTSNTARGVVWDGLIQLVKYSHDKGNKFLDQIITEGLPNVHQDHFTTPFMNFLKFVVQYLEIRHHRDNTPQDNNPTVGVIELVWKLLIETNDESAYQLSSDYLATFYLDSIFFGIESLKDIASMHVEVVRRCLSYLESAFTELSAQQKQSAADNKFLTSTEYDQGHSPEHRFRRVLTLLGKMICFIHRRKIFREDSPTLDFWPSPPPDCDKKFGIKFRMEDGVQPLELEVGYLETRQELESRLHQLTGIPLFELTSSGECTRLLERPMQTLGVFLGNKGNEVLQIRGLYLDFRTWCSAGVSVYSSPRTSLERIVIGNFSTFYKFLWRNDTISRLVCNLGSKINIRKLTF